MNAITEPIEHDRLKHIGGSDAAAILGVSPYHTPVELWMLKTGRMVETIDAAQQKRFDRGHKLEPFIRDMVIDKLRGQGHDVELIACNNRFHDPQYSWLSVEIDFELMLDGEHINCDAKSVSGFARKKWGEEDTEDVPIEYAAQFMTGLMVTGKNKCLVAALRGFDDVDIYWTLRDDETIAAMREKIVLFWEGHVLMDVAPDPYTFDDVKLLFPCDDGSDVDSTEEIYSKVKQLQSVKSQISALEEREETLKIDIAEFISPHAILKWNSKQIASWKGQLDTRLDLDKFKEEQPEMWAKYKRTKTIRVLRLKKDI